MRINMEQISKKELEEIIVRRIRCNDNAPVGHLEHLLKCEYIDCSPEERWVDFRVVIPQEVSNRIKTAHGGYVAAIGDECMAIATNALISKGDMLTTTLDMQIHTMKAMFPGDEIIIHCDHDHMGKRSILANARFYRGRELCAVVTQNFMLLPKDHVEYVKWEK